MVTFNVQDCNGEIRKVEVPEDMNLSLMEVLKASEYDILATCGGMALCATCHIEVEDGVLGEPSDAELDMLDTLPSASDESRLACQIKVGPELEGVTLKLKSSEEE